MIQKSVEANLNHDVWLQLDLHSLRMFTTKMNLIVDVEQAGVADVDDDMPSLNWAVVLLW